MMERFDNKQADDYIDSYNEAYDEWNQINVIPIINLSSTSQDSTSTDCKVINKLIGDNQLDTNCDNQIVLQSSSNDYHEKSTAINNNDNEIINMTTNSSIINSTINPVTLDEVDHYFSSVVNLSQLRDKIKPVQPISFWKKVKSILTFNHNQVRKLNCNLISQRNDTFALALLPFDNTDPWHYRFLVTIYTQLVNHRENNLNNQQDNNQQSQSIPRYGQHWEAIGFQGIDPATDLRGVGLFGLYQLLHLTNCPDNLILCQDIYSLSIDSVQSFPLSAMSTNLTAIVLQLLRSGRLNGYLNKRFSSLIVNNQSTNYVCKMLNQLYVDLYFTLFKIWIKQNKTIKDAGFVLKEIRIKCYKQLNSIIGSSANYGSKVNQRLLLKETNCVTFSNIGDLFDTPIS